MTHTEAITAAKAVRPSDFTDLQLARWLCEFDGQMMLDYVAQYASQEEMDASYGGRGAEAGVAWSIGVVDAGSTTSTDWTELMSMDLQAAQAPYDGLYLDWLVMQIDHHNADYERYNNDAVLAGEKLRVWQNRLSRRNWHNLNKFDPKTKRGPTVIRF